MKKFLLFTTLCLSYIAWSQNGDIGTVNNIPQNYIQRFGLVTNFNGNWYTNQTMFGGAFFNPGDLYFTATLTGTASAYSWRGTSVNGLLDFNINTPDLPYSGSDALDGTADGQFDRRAMMYYNLKNECCNNNRAISIINGRNTFSMKVNNLSGSPAKVRIDLFPSTTGINPFFGAYPSSSTFIVATIPANSMGTILQTFSGITNLSAFSIRTAGLPAGSRIQFDDIYIGFKLPSGVELSSNPVNVTQVYAGSVLPFLGSVRNDVGGGQNDPIFTPQIIDWSVINGAGVNSTISGEGVLTVGGASSGMLTVVGAASMDPSIRLTYVLDVTNPSSFSITGPSYIQVPGETFTASLDAIPAGGTQGLVRATFTSSNSLVARINSITGEFVSAGNGVVTITARTIVPPVVNITKVVTIVGQLDPIGIFITSENNTINSNGGSLLMSSTVYPPGSDQAVNWTSLNTAVATVNANTGVVRAVRDGVTTIRGASVRNASIFMDFVVNVSGQITVPQPFLETFTGQWSGDWWGGWPFVPGAFSDLNTQANGPYDRTTIPGVGTLGSRDELRFSVNEPSATINTNEQIYYMVNGEPWAVRGVVVTSVPGQRVASMTVRNYASSAAKFQLVVMRNNNNAYGDGGGRMMPTVDVFPGDNYLTYDLTTVPGGVNNVTGFKFRFASLQGEAAIDNIIIGAPVATSIADISATNTGVGGLVTITGPSNGRTITVYSGASVRLLPSMLPTNAIQNAVEYIIYSETNPGLVSVSGGGELTVGHPGTGTTVLKLRPFNTTPAVQYYVNIEVINPGAPVGMTLAASNQTISAFAGTSQLTVASTTPSNSNPLVRWSIPDGQTADLITVNSLTGLVRATGKKNGTINVQATSLLNNSVVATIPITVLDQVPTLVTITGPGHQITTPLGGIQLTASLLPATAPQLFNWSVSNTSLADLSPAGLVVAKGNGVVVVTARATNNTAVLGTYTITISGQPSITGVTLTLTGAPEVTVAKGRLNLIAKVYPLNATQEVTWEVSPADVGRVDGGMYTALKDGAATVVARSIAAPSISASMVITNTNQDFSAFEQGYFYDNFTGSYGGTQNGPGVTRYSAYGTSQFDNPDLTAMKSATRNNGFLIIEYKNTTGGATENYTRNSAKIVFGQTLAKMFNATTAGLRFTVLSSQDIDVMMGFSANEFTFDPSPRAFFPRFRLVKGLNTVNVTIARGGWVNNTTVAGGNVENGFSWGSGYVMYMAINPWTNIPKSPGGLTFLGIALGYEAQEVVSTVNGINVASGVTQLLHTVTGKGALDFLAINQDLNYELNDPNGLAYLRDSDPSIIGAYRTGNGDVTITGTTINYPFLKTSKVINISNNTPQAPTSYVVSVYGINPSNPITNGVQNVRIGEVLTFIPIVAPQNTSNRSNWEISGVAVRTILSEINGSQRLVLTPLANGSLSVKASQLFYSSFSRTFDFRVSTPVTAFVITSAGSVIRTQGGTMQFGIGYYEPAGAVVPSDIKWSVINVPGRDRAVIDNVGLLTAKGNGVVTVVGTLVQPDNGGDTLISTKVINIFCNSQVEFITVIGAALDIESYELNMYPNPVTDGKLTIAGPDEIESVEFVSNTGVLVGKAIIGRKAYLLDISHLSSGMYTAVIRLRSGKVERRRIIKS